ncbi:DUF1175 family protein [Iodobacter ciconiae]|uniref:DUF1175 family protein n=1 Tax=Iodobacter ciconiae TaxID=2496266 RepID=UPI0019CFE9BB|nr:DUF1175 family protein [Iodobacter ciconiae]
MFLSKYLCTGLILLSTTCLAADPVLNPAQTQAFRGWFVRIVNEQLRQGQTRAGSTEIARGWCVLQWQKPCKNTTQHGCKVMALAERACRQKWI